MTPSGYMIMVCLIVFASAIAAWTGIFLIDYYFKKKREFATHNE